jgi:hypothetical protein
VEGALDQYEELQRECAEYGVPYITLSEEQWIRRLRAEGRDIRDDYAYPEDANAAIYAWREMLRELELAKWARAHPLVHEEVPANPAPLVEPQQPVGPRRKKKIPVDWDGYVKPPLFARYDDAAWGLPDSSSDNLDWQRQADAERFVGDLCVPTGKGKHEAQIKKLAVESTMRKHVSRLTKEYAEARGLEYDKQKKRWRITPKAGK